MRIITLSGNPDTGKTTSLMKLYSDLKDRGAEDILSPCSCQISGADKEFFVAWNGKRIGIVTMGDYAYEIIWHLGVYYGRNADVLVVANSNKSAPYSIIKWHGFDHVDIKKENINETGIEESIINSILL